MAKKASTFRVARLNRKIFITLSDREAIALKKMMNTTRPAGVSTTVHQRLLTIADEASEQGSEIERAKPKRRSNGDGRQNPPSA